MRPLPEIYEEVCAVRKLHKILTSEGRICVLVCAMRSLVIVTAGAVGMLETAGVVDATAGAFFCGGVAATVFVPDVVVAAAGAGETDADVVAVGEEGICAFCTTRLALKPLSAKVTHNPTPSMNVPSADSSELKNSIRTVYFRDCRHKRD